MHNMEQALSCLLLFIYTPPKGRCYLTTIGGRRSERQVFPARFIRKKQERTSLSCFLD